MRARRRRGSIAPVSTYAQGFDGRAGAWLAARTDGGDWVHFDLFAPSAGVAAQAAIRLREALPEATVRSEPDPSASDDPDRPHRLLCAAIIPGSTGTQMQAAIEAAIAASVRLDFHAPPALPLAA